MKKNSRFAFPVVMTPALLFLTSCQTQISPSTPKGLSQEATWRLGCEQGASSDCASLARFYEISTDPEKNRLASSYDKRACSLGFAPSCSTEKIQTPFPKQATLAPEICPNEIQNNIYQDCQDIFTQIRDDILQKGSIFPTPVPKLTASDFIRLCQQKPAQCYEISRNLFLPKTQINVNTFRLWMFLSLFSCFHQDERSCTTMIPLLTYLSNINKSVAALVLLKQIGSLQNESKEKPVEHMITNLLKALCEADKTSCGGYALWLWRGVNQQNSDLTEIQNSAQIACTHGGVLGCGILKELSKDKPAHQ